MADDGARNPAVIAEHIRDLIDVGVDPQDAFDFGYALHAQPLPPSN
jgi:hypothetical protein